MVRFVFTQRFVTSGFFGGFPAKILTCHRFVRFSFWCAFLQICNGNDIDRLNLGRRMNTMTERLTQALSRFMPGHLTLQSTLGDTTQPAVVQTVLAGVGIDMERLNESMKVMRRDEDESARKLFNELTVICLDGSGTVIYEGSTLDSRMMHYCYWKDEYQLRWYVVVDMMGNILFVSGVYPGKLDDSEALKQTGFYTYAIASLVVRFFRKKCARVLFFFQLVSEGIQFQNRS